MAKRNASAKAEPKITNDINTVSLLGTVLRPKQSEKVCRFTLVCASLTPNGNLAKSYIPVVWFNGGSDETVAEDERVVVNGFLKSGKYENKDGHTVYTLDVVADEVIFE